MPRETPSPIDLPGPAVLGGPGLGWASIAIATTTVLLLLTNAVALRDWINEQPPGPVQSHAAVMADQWVAFTDHVGLGAPRAVMHRLWKRAEAARFAGQEAAGPDAAGE